MEESCAGLQAKETKSMPVLPDSWLADFADKYEEGHISEAIGRKG